MIMTMDALLGTTLSLALMTTTMPVMVGVAKKTANLRKDVVATAVAGYCNSALLAEEDIDAADINVSKGLDEITGDCGVSGNDLTLTFNSGDTRVLSYDGIDELYIVL